MYSNFVSETTATTGTGTMTLSSRTGYVRFSDVFSNGSLVYYVIQDGTNRECGIGTVGASNTLARTTILEKLESGTRTANPGTGLNLSGSGVLVYCDTIAQGLMVTRKGADVASATTTTIWTSDGWMLDVTGTTTITSFGTASRAGEWRMVRFTGALTLTNGANLILPGSANITTANGDFALVLALTTTQHVVMFYQKANGNSVVSALLLTGGTMSGAVQMGNNNITGMKTGSFNGEYDNGNSGTGITIDFSNGQCQKVTLNSATPTLTMANGPGVGHYQLKIIQDGTGSRAPSWAGTNYSASRWLNSSSAPSVNTTASAETLSNWYWDGSKWYQSLAKVGTT